jgi:hypothetical protein
VNGKGSFINCSQIRNWGYCVFTCAKELNITVLFSGFSAMLPKLKLLVIENGVIHMTIAACELIPIVSHTEGIRSVYLGRCARGDYLRRADISQNAGECISLFCATHIPGLCVTPYIRSAAGFCGMIVASSQWNIHHNQVKC